MTEFKAAFRYLKDGKHLVTIKDVRKRSLPQNAYYWGVVVPMVLRGLRDAGFDEVENNEQGMKENINNDLLNPSNNLMKSLKNKVFDFKQKPFCGQC